MNLHLDNSAFSLLSCDRRFQLRVIEGKSGLKSAAATFGDAVHKGLEYLDKGESPDETMAHLHSLNLGVSIPKVMTLITYYKLSRELPPPLRLFDGSLAVELKFSNKYAEILLPNDHEKTIITLEGTIDRIYIEDDTLVILDYKTTAAATPHLLEKKINEYALSFQLPFYLYALKNFGILPAAYIPYITERKYRMEIHLLAYNINPPTFKRHIRPAFNDDFIDREVPLIINHKIQQAVAIAQLKTPAPHTGMTVYQACTYCDFRAACLSMGEAREDEILSRFDVVPYAPLTFR